MKLFKNHFSGKVRKAVSASMVAVMTASVLSGCGGFDNPLSKDSKKEETTSEETATSTEAKGFDETSEEVQKKTKTIEALINQYYYFDVDDEKREESYYDGLLDGLDDPYSVYYTESEYQKLIEDDKGTFSGIGSTVSQNAETGFTYVVKPLK